MIETVKKILGIGKKTTGIKLIVSCERLEKRVALLENNRLEEYTIERESDRNIVGSIFKGRVRNIEHGPQGDVRGHRLREERFPPILGCDPGRARQRHGRGRRGTEPRKKGQKNHRQGCSQHLPRGLRSPRAGKKGPDRHQGPAHHDQHQPGRALPRADALQRPVRHLAQDRGSQGARPAAQDLRELDVPEGMGVIIRTVGEGQRARYFVRDLASCCEQWDDIRGGIEEQAGAGVLLPGARSDRAHRARFSHRRDRRGHHATTTRACEAHAGNGRPDLRAPASAFNITPVTADLRVLRRPEADRRRLSPPGLAALRRLHRHR